MILIRVDASLDIGTGHLMRCLALAQGLQELGKNCIFVMIYCPLSLQERIKQEGFNFLIITSQLGTIEDAEITIKLAKNYAVQWIILDGYNFKGAYQKYLKQADFNVLCFDDYNYSDYYCTDFILNQNLGASADLYQNKAEHTQLLLGTEYILLRKEFRKWQSQEKVINSTVKKILVTLGGSDPNNVTLKVIEGLKSLNNQDLEIIVVIGGSNPHKNSLVKACQDSRSSIKILENVTNMPELMAWADLAISAGGSTVWELAFMGVPSLLIILADNQVFAVEELDKRGLIINLGWYDKITPQMIMNSLLPEKLSLEKRLAIQQNGLNLIDGYGYSRIIQFLQ